ncbi:MAG: DEAD/DEAH box helicase, partial [Chthoniobacterales bacterium]|nr:DEAD/DEAH box helicase [Chthoniobacterales bacterium]
MNHAYTIYPCHDMEPGCTAHDSRLLNREARSAPSGQSLVRNSDQHGQVLADPPQPTGSTAHASLQATAHELDHVRYTGHPIAQCSGTCSAKGQLGSMGPVTSPADHAVCGAEEPVPVLCRINEAVTLFNGTPLGRVLNERQLLRHRTHANQTFVAGDRHRHTVRIDVLRYVAWLVDRLHAGIDDHALDVVEKWNGRALVLTHVRELVDQNAAQVARFLSPLLVGVNSAGLKRRDLDHPVIVAGIQSVYQKACDLGRFDIILIDEVHLLPPDGEGMYQTFLRDAKAVNPSVRVIGLTATPFRLKDGAICGPDNILNHICFEVGVKELIRDGFLSPLISKAGKAKADTSGLHVRAGEFVAEEVERLCDADDLVRAACIEIVEQTRERKACLIFAAGVKHAEHVVAVLRTTHGLEVACIFGHTPDAERDRIIARFKRGELRYLVNVAVLTTGFDAPHVDCVALLRPTMSAGLYYQMCLDMDTEVLTRVGWRRCHEVARGDEVGAF